MRRPLTAPLSAPLSHRIVHALAARGIRGSRRLWRLVLATQPIAPDGTITVGGVQLARETHPDKRRALYRCEYETTELRILPLLVDRGDLAVDVGANIGLYTFALSSLVGPTGTVISVEPSPTVRTTLTEAAEQAGVTNLDIVGVAIGAAPGSAVLVAPIGDPGLGTLRGLEASDVAESYEVPVRTLDELVGAREVGYLKVDTEGWEGEVMAGSTRLLGDRRVRAAMLELTPSFGKLDYACHLTELPGYRAHLVDLALGRLRTLPVLRPVSASDILALEEQRTLLLVRDDAMGRVGALLRGEH